MRLLVQIVDQKNQIPLWKSFTGMHIWILLTLVAVTLNELLLQNISKEQSLLFYLKTLMLTS